MAYAEHVYVYPDAASLRPLRIRRQDLPAGCVPIGIARDDIDGVEVKVVVYVATGEAADALRGIAPWPSAPEPENRSRGRAGLSRAG